MEDVNELKLDAKKLRDLAPSQIDKSKIKRHDLYIILDNVLDTYNIGSIFRLADATGTKKILLCEGSETPPNHRIKKASINTTEIVDWEYYPKTTEAIESLRRQVPGIRIVAIELAEGSVNYTDYDYLFPLALVVGHETHGVSPEVLNVVDTVVELPMYGINISLNVMVSLAIVLYHALSKVIDIQKQI